MQHYLVVTGFPSAFDDETIKDILSGVGAADFTTMTAPPGFENCRTCKVQFADSEAAEAAAQNLDEFEVWQAYCLPPVLGFA